MSSSAGPRPKSEGPLGLMIAVVAVVAGAALLERLTRPNDRGETTAPTPLPEFAVAGWLNTGGAAPPTPSGLRGRFVVLDLWSTDCLPCLRALPRLAEFYRKWRDRGVEVVGLADDPPANVLTVEATIARVEGMDWPVAYGAGLVHQQLGVRMIPTLVLFDERGISVWRGHSIEALEAELARQN